MIIHNLQKINLIILFNLIISILFSCSNHEILVKMNGSAQVKSHFFQLDQGVDSMEAQTFLNEIGIKKDTINFLKMFNECYSSYSIKNLTIEKKISDQYLINYNITNLDSLSKYLDPICGTSPIILLVILLGALIVVYVSPGVFVFSKRPLVLASVCGDSRASLVLMFVSRGGRARHLSQGCLVL